MLALIKLIGVVALVLLALDGIWLGLISKPFYVTYMKDMITLKDGSIQVNLAAAVAVYIVLILGIVVFVYPMAQGQLLKALFYGALFGLVTYGTYDFTNMALLRHWSWTLTLVDIAWGMILCALTSVAAVAILG